MRLTAKAWSDYADRLSRLNTKAGQLMRAYLEEECPHIPWHR